MVVGLLDPPRETILLGQINILLVAAVIADMTLVRTERRGVLVGLAAASKIVPIILIPYLLLTRQVGAWRRAAGAFVVAAGVAFTTSPNASWAYWTHYVWDPSRAGGLAWVGNQGAVGVIERLVHRPLGSLEMFALAAVISGIGLLIAVTTYRRSWPVLGFLGLTGTPLECSRWAPPGGSTQTSHGDAPRRSRGGLRPLILGGEPGRQSVAPRATGPRAARHVRRADGRVVLVIGRPTQPAWCVEARVAPAQQ